MKNYVLPEKIDLSKVILWQYENASRLKQIVSLLEDSVNEGSIALWKLAFYTFDLDRPINATDSDYELRLQGLSNLSILFGLQRPMWHDGSTRSYVGVNTWRLYLKGMIWLMDSDGSCEDINKWLSIIFPGRTSFVIDNLNMTIIYKFFPFPEEGTDEYQLLSIENFLPHPAGVKYFVNPINEDVILGTEGQNGGQLDASRFGEPTT